MAKPKYIFIHHSVTPQNSSWKVIDDIHKKKWNFRSSLGHYAGYNYIIEANGFVMQARRDNETGAHTYVPGKNYNNEGFAICLVGNFENDKPTEKQEESLATLIALKMDQYKIPRDRVLLHRELKATACPGRNITQGYITKIIKEDNMATKLSDLPQNSLNKLIDMAGGRWSGATKSRNKPDDKKAPWITHNGDVNMVDLINILHSHNALEKERVEGYRAKIELPKVQKELDELKKKKAEDMSALSKLEQIKIILGIK